MTLDVTKDRLGKIGGSDLPDILGHGYNSPYQAWRRITGRDPAKKDNEHMRRGRLMEPGVAALLAAEMGDELGVEMRHVQGPRVTHPKHDFLIGHPDWFIVDPGQRQVVLSEVKCPARVEWDEPPAYYRTQLNHYHYLVTLDLSASFGGGCKYGFDQLDQTRMSLAVLCGPLRRFDYTPDHVMAAEYVAYAAEWHARHVVRDIPPPMTTAEDVAITFPTSTKGRTLQATRALIEQIAELDARKQQLKKFEDDVEARENALRVTMADAEAIICGDMQLVTFASHYENRVDFETMRSIVPQPMQRKFTVQQPVRKLLLKRKAIAAARNV